MSDEIDLLKYLLNNLKMQQTLLYKVIKKKEVKDEIYEIMRYEIYEYRKFIISIKRMLQNRLKKYNKELNVLLGVASSTYQHGLELRYGFFYDTKRKSKKHEKNG